MNFKQTAASDFTHQLCHVFYQDLIVTVIFLSYSPDREENEGQALKDVELNDPIKCILIPVALKQHSAVPDDVGCRFPLLGQQLRVMHHFLQEGNNLRLQLIVTLKVLQRHGQHAQSVLNTADVFMLLIIIEKRLALNLFHSVQITISNVFL